MPSALARVGSLGFIAVACLLLVACGSSRPAPMPIDDDVPELPGTRPALQMYLVLTDDPQAMQGEGAVEEMWRAVHGQNPEYRAIRDRLMSVPGSYELDVELDYADLPHPALTPESLAPVIATLPAELQEKARGAKLAVRFISRAPVLPDGGHVRLVGAAALYAAEAHDGVVLDLLAYRGYAPATWRALLENVGLADRLVRVVERRGDGGRMIRTRGNARLGAPDLVMKGVSDAQLSAARQHFAEVLGVLIEQGVSPNAALRLDGKSVALKACAGVAVDVACVQIDAP